MAARLAPPIWASTNNNVMVTMALAQRFWPGESAIGRRIKFGDLTSENPWLTIVGVREGREPARHSAESRRAIPTSSCRSTRRRAAFAVLLRTNGDPSALGRPATDVMQPPRTRRGRLQRAGLEQLVAQQLAASRFLTWLTGVFAGTALVLAIIGIYGLLAYWVGQRTREIGVRAALGAGRGQLIGLVVGQGVTLAAIGVVAGGLAAAGLGRFVETQLYAVRPLDIVSYAATAGVMIGTAFIASLVPAFRALRVDPISALRGE